MIHDIEPKHLYNEWKPNAVPKRSSAVVQFCGRNLLCRIDDNGLKLPSRAMFPDGDEQDHKDRAYANRQNAEGNHAAIPPDCIKRISIVRIA